MLNDEEADDKATERDAHEHDQPRCALHQPDHGQQQDREWDSGRQDLADAKPRRRRAELRAVSSEFARFEDALFAGAVVERILRMGNAEWEMENDQALLVRDAWQSFVASGQSLASALRDCQGGKNLIAEGFDADIDTVDMNIADETTVEGLLTASIANFGANLDDEQRRANRWGRLAILAAAEHNEVLHKEVSAQQIRSSRALINVIEKAQSQGLVRTDISARAIALLVEAVPLGTVLADINPETAPTQQEWVALITELLLAFSPR
mgnify:CR=1 FL=1